MNVSKQFCILLDILQVILKSKNLSLFRQSLAMVLTKNQQQKIN